MNDPVNLVDPSGLLQVSKEYANLSNAQDAGRRSAVGAIARGVLALGARISAILAAAGAGAPKPDGEPDPNSGGDDGSNDPPDDNKDDDEECKRLRQQGENLVRELDQRTEAMQIDQHNLFEDHPTLDDPHPAGHGSWEGHQVKFRRVQNSLFDLTTEMLANNCDVPSSFYEARSRTMPRFPFDFN